MRVKDRRSLKALSKNMKEKTGIEQHIITRNYMMERLIHRLSLSKYRDLFIIKGGFLLSSLVGLENRFTQDIDSTMIGPRLPKEDIIKMFSEIVSMDIGDNVTLEITGTDPIRISEENEGLRIYILAQIEKTRVPFSVDITVGDYKTFKGVEYGFPMIFDDGKINVMCYTFETMLSEKIEAILERNAASTRMRDFYDVYIIDKLYSGSVNYKNLRETLLATSKRRGCDKQLKEYKNLVKNISESDQIKRNWERYQKSNPFAQGIDINETLRVVSKILDQCKL